MKRWILIVLIALELGAVVVIVGFAQIKLDALQEPRHLETLLATRAKHILVRRSSRDGIPSAPTNLVHPRDQSAKKFFEFYGSYNR
jgi:hypothetical protein